jgi:N-acetyl-gamma-glutamyl-phosphate reductase
MKTLRVGIVGGAGYTGGELLRLVLRHPNIHIAFVHSTSNAGKYAYEAHPDLLGETELRFTGGTLAECLHEHSDALDVLFLCVGHGEAKKILAEHQTLSSSQSRSSSQSSGLQPICVIDLSQDFRYADTPSWLYGLPELNRDAIRQARTNGQHIANPGCFATCVQLGLLPLAYAGLLTHDIHTSGITGSTGAGQGLSATSHFSWRSNNVGIYKALTHQHLREIRASLTQLQPSFLHKLNFIPYRGSFTRGILAASYITCDLSHEQAVKLYADYYASHPFVHLTTANPDVKQVVNTNKCALYLEHHDDTLLVITAIDNLTKGASGQAVQNMNLVFGLDETAGLLLKPSAF